MARIAPKPLSLAVPTNALVSAVLIALRAFWTAESTFAKAWLRSSSVKPSLSRIS